MNKNYKNYINVVDTQLAHINPSFYDDFESHIISLAGDFSSAPISSISNKIACYFFRKHKNDNIIYVFTNKNTPLNDNEISIIRSNEFVKHYEQVSHIKDLELIYNAILQLSVMKDKNLAPFEMNGNYYRIIKSTKSQKITLNCHFIYSKQNCNNLLLETNIATFTHIDELDEKDIKKDTQFFEEKNGVMVKCGRHDNCFVHRNPFKKTEKHAYSLKKGSFDKADLKIITILELYKTLINSKYIDNFTFQHLNMKKEKSATGKIKISHTVNINNFYQENKLNVVTNGLTFDDAFFSDISELKDADIVFSSNETKDNMLNLVILEHGKKDKHTDSDRVYKENQLSDAITQHIVLSHLQKEALITSLTELAIKKDLRDHRIDLFDWDIFKDANFNTLTFIKKDLNKEVDEYAYFSIKINVHTGEISDIFIDDDDILDLECIDRLQSKTDSWAVCCDTGFSMSAINTDIVMFPDLKLYDEELQKIKTGKEFHLEANEWYSIFKELADKYVEFQELRTREDIRKTFNLSNDKLWTPSKVQKEFKISGKTKRLLDEYLRENYDAAIELHIKSSNDLNRIFPSLEGVCYTKHQYAVADSFDNPENQSRHIHLKEISYYDNTDADFFESLLPLFFVPFVRLNKMSTIPFPIKYLNELIEQHNYLFEK